MNQTISLYKERIQLAVHRRYFMTDFVRNSLQTLEQLIDQQISSLSQGDRVGIFGIKDAASVTYHQLLKRGYKDIFFIQTDPFSKSHRGHKLVNVKSAEVNRADAVFATSLSHGQVQSQKLRENGFKGDIYYLPDLRHLSTELINDSASSRSIRNLKNLHFGRPAFVIGNGPSLKKTDPRLIGDKIITFAGNGIVHLKGFIPGYYFALDDIAVRMWNKEMGNLSSRRFYQANLKSFVNSYKFLRRADDIFFPVCYEQKGSLDIFDWYRFGFESGNTIVCPMLQFALLMGCRPIYLIGVDLSYDTKNNYFTKSYHVGKARKYHKSDIGRINGNMQRGIKRAVEACRKEGVEVFNCSPTKNIPFLTNIAYHKVIQS